MNATERMAYCADLDLDLETTLAVLRLDYSQDEIGTALDAMPRPVLQRWVETMRLIAIPKKKSSF